MPEICGWHLPSPRMIFQI